MKNPLLSKITEKQLEQAGFTPQKETRSQKEFDEWEYENERYLLHFKIQHSDIFEELLTDTLTAEDLICLAYEAGFQKGGEDKENEIQNAVAKVRRFLKI